MPSKLDDTVTSHKIVFASKSKLPPSVFTPDRTESTDSMEISRNTIGNFNSFDIMKGADDRIFTKRDYIVFALAFALAEAPVVATLTFAPILLPTIAVGGWGNGIFYISFAICSMSTAKSFVQTFGCKRALLYGYVGTAVYMYGWGMFLALFPNQMNFIFPLFSAVGGISQAIMCTAQGLYFALSSQMTMASMNTDEIQRTHRRLAHVFSFIQLISLIFGFGLCTLYFTFRWSQRSALLFLVVPTFCVQAFVTSVLLLNINDLGDRGNPVTRSLVIRRGVLDMFLIYKEFSLPRRSKLFLLLPFHLCWGICTAFWIYIVLGHFIYDKGGAVIVGVSATLQFAVTLVFTIIDKFIRHPSAQYAMVVFGGCCFCAMGVLVTSNAHIAAIVIAILFANLHGIGRSVCDNNMLSVVADFFPLTEGAAYSMVGFAKTVSAGFSFIIFATMETSFFQFDIFAGIVIVTASLGIAGFVAASRIDSKEKCESDAPSSRLASFSDKSDRSRTISSDTMIFVPDYY